MIVGGYDLHLYCDFAGPHGFRESRGQFSGCRKSDAIRAAKSDGWRFFGSGTSTTAKCPKCVKGKITDPAKESR